MKLVMKMKFAFSTLLFFGLCFLTLDAQMAEDPWIKFEEITHDFGKLDQGAKTENNFKFTNISKEIVHLTSVKASCGCTTPEWTKEDIAPGKSGEIKVSYNSQRVGPFNKSIMVNYNDKPEPITIYISGQIEAKEVVQTEEQNILPGVTDFKAPTGPAINYVTIRGALAFENIALNVKSLTSEEEQELEFHFKNVSSLPVKIRKEKTDTDPEIAIVFKDEELKPNQESTLKVKISGKQMKDAGQVDGYFSKTFAFFTDESDLNKKELTLNGSFKRVFTEEEKATTPHIEFAVTSAEGGKIIEGEQYVYDFQFKNTGHSPLKILSAKASCGCTAIKPITESIAPGETGAITATFNSKGRVGMQSKSINVTTNDIENPVVGLRFTVEVVKDPFHADGVVEQQ